MQRSDARQTPPWVWVTLGLGSGLLLTLVVGAGLRYLGGHDLPDPRARQVEDLLEEAERLLAQGRRAKGSRRGVS